MSLAHLEHQIHRANRRRAKLFVRYRRALQRAQAKIAAKP